MSEDPIVFYSFADFSAHEDEMSELEGRDRAVPIHVIEYSAYEALKEENKRLKEHLRFKD